MNKSFNAPLKNEKRYHAVTYWNAFREKRIWNEKRIWSL